jgi:hypothetical protein
MTDSRLILPGDPDQPTNGVVFRCQRCGGDLPPMAEDLAKLARSTAGVTLAHDVCPGDEPATAQPEGRYFEVRVEVVEVTEPTAPNPIPPYANGSTEQEAGRVQVTEMLSFQHGVRAKDLDAAMRPLAEGLGEKWMKAEKNAAIADPANGG